MYVSDYFSTMSEAPPARLIVVGITLLYFGWQLYLRFFENKKSGEPPMFPYWFPIIGHSISFLQDTNSSLIAGRKYFRDTREPFSVLLGGRKTYIITNPKHINETYKKTAELNFDAFVDHVMGLVGVSQPARSRMWSGTVPDTKLSVPNSIRHWVRVDLQSGSQTDILYEYFRKEVNRVVLDSGRPTSQIYRAARLPNEPEGVMSLLKWSGDIIVASSTNALFGSVCLDRSPEILDAFHSFNHNAWKLLFQYPKKWSKEAHDGKDGTIDGLTRYFDMPKEQRPGTATFIARSESEMRAHGVESRDIASVIFKLFWAINGNPSILAFWLLAHALYIPNLLEDIRSETAKAFTNGLNSEPDITILLEHCPILNALWFESLRVHGGASTFRRVVEHTVVGGYHLIPGADVMMPYRQLHLDASVWGANADTFDPNRFLHNPQLIKDKHFRPFGGGSTFCPGRQLARQTALAFVAEVAGRFEVEVVGGVGSQGFPEMDGRKPTLGIISPVPGQDIKVRITARVV